MELVTLASALTPPLDGVLVNQLLREYVSLEQRYILSDWEPATLDGGQLAEAAARILYHQDCRKLERTRGVNECISYVLDLDKSGTPLRTANSHSFPERRAAQEIARVVKMVYGFRSRRGAVHITPEYTANQLDAQLVVSGCRWLVGETVRIFSGAAPAEVAQTIKTIVRMEVPGIGSYSGRKLVQCTHLTAEEEVLLLLYEAGENGLKQADVVRDAEVSASSVSKALASLRASAKRQALSLNGQYRITDLGIRRVVQTVVPKLQ